MKSDLGNLVLGYVARRSCRSFQRTAIEGLVLRWGTALLLCAMTIGCAGVNSGYKGTSARTDNRFPLVTMDGTPATWQTKDIALHYNAGVSNDAIGINGTVERLGTIKHYSIVSNFRVRMHFLNAEGIILESHMLWGASTGRETKFVRWTFDKNFPLPVGATAIAFSYRGTLFDGQGVGDGRSGFTVWQTP